VSYESLDYRLEGRHRGYEIRRYDSHLVAETVVAGTFDGSGNEAFRRLAGYIFGNNSASLKMAMTVPVMRTAAEGGHEYRFVIGRAFTEGTLPDPQDARVTIRRIPAGVFAVTRYRGSPGEHRYRREKLSLLDRLAIDGIVPAGPPFAAVYNGPFTPPPLRRNEVLVPIAWDEADPAA